jgi:hypothetical protein
MTKWYGNTQSEKKAFHSWDTDDNLDLRIQFNNFVLGDEDHAGAGVFMVHRTLDKSRRCACWNINRGSSSDCKYCKGESYLWEENFIRGYFTQTYGRALIAPTAADKLFPPGIFDLDKALIYLPFDANPSTNDSVFRIKLNNDGKPYYPIERVEKWRAVAVEDRRQENGEIAFWILVCERVEF